MSERDEPVNEARAWHDDPNWLSAEMESRAAALLGRAILDRVAASIRAQMAEGRAATAQAQAREIDGQVAELRRKIEALAGQGSGDVEPPTGAPPPDGDGSGA